MISSLGKQSPLRQFAAVRASAQDVGMLLAAAADEAAKAAEAVKPGSVEAPSGETHHAHGASAHREPRAASFWLYSTADALQCFCPGNTMMPVTCIHLYALSAEIHLHLLRDDAADVALQAL